MTNVVRTVRPTWILLALGAVACQSEPTGPEAVEQAPTYSDGGSEPQLQPVPRIAFVGTDSAGHTQVYNINRTGSGLKQLTQQATEHIWDVVWSPSGPSRLAFHTDEHAYVMAADGTGLQDLTPAGMSVVWDLVWSPDGTRLAMRDRDPATNVINLSVLNADGTGVVHLASDPSWITPPAWSPDGQRLMYYTRTDYARTLFIDRGVWTIKPDGTGRTKVLTVQSAWYDNFQYSPDGTKVVICRDLDAILMNPNGTGLTSLGVGCESETGPQWSPSGTRILTVEVIGSREQVFAIDPDGTDKVQLTFANISSDEAMWSRNGGWIGFRRGLTGGTMDVWVMKADGSEKTQLTTGMKLDGGVSWGPEPTLYPY